MEKQNKKTNKRLVFKSPYQELAKKYSVHPDYVGQIARGTRKAVRGKAKEIREELEQMVKNDN
jgi:hypothetical protein